MLKCLNRVRSFQEVPAACEGAFVDEAAEDGCSVADLAPHELENRYYSLKQISSSSPPADEDDEELEDKEAEADESSDDNNLSDSDSDNTEEMHHKHKHHHRQTKDGRTDSSNDDETTHSPYNANVILNDDNAANVAEIEDIEVDLPQNYNYPHKSDQ